MLVAIRRKIGSWIAQYLSKPIPNYQPFSTYEIPVLESVLQPGDVILVEGDTRVSSAIKYLTQSTWSHAAMYIGEQPGVAFPEGRDDEPNSSPNVLIEAELGFGVIATPLSKYRNFNIRICRPVNLTEEDRQTVVQTMINNLGKNYDLKHIFDLARYLFSTPPVPIRFRRRMLALGSGDPSRAICSSLVAETFQSIQYPILPTIEKTNPSLASSYRAKEIYHIRHHSLFTPKDFDVSPYFQIIKPTIENGFNYQSLVFNVENETKGELKNV
ncbi:MAG: lipo-like protein [Gammaproteobacteria bacterium]|nr:lipo-like protein [Gammaproteobacteria bacterium]